MSTQSGLSRRRFLKTSGALVVGFYVAPRTGASGWTSGNLTTP